MAKPYVRWISKQTPFNLTQYVQISLDDVSLPRKRLSLFTHYPVITSQITHTIIGGKDRRIVSPCVIEPSRGERGRDQVLLGRTRLAGPFVLREPVISIDLHLLRVRDEQHTKILVGLLESLGSLASNSLRIASQLSASADSAIKKLLTTTATKIIVGYKSEISTTGRFILSVGRHGSFSEGDPYITVHVSQLDKRRTLPDDDAINAAYDMLRNLLRRSDVTGGEVKQVLDTLQSLLELSPDLTNTDAAALNLEIRSMARKARPAGLTSSKSSKAARIPTLNSLYRRVAHTNG